MTDTTLKKCPIPGCGGDAVSRVRGRVSCGNDECPMHDEELNHETWQSLPRPSAELGEIAGEVRAEAQVMHEAGAKGVPDMLRGWADQLDSIAAPETKQQGECSQCDEHKSDVHIVCSDCIVEMTKPTECDQGCVHPAQVCWECAEHTIKANQLIATSEPKQPNQERGPAGTACLDSDNPPSWCDLVGKLKDAEDRARQLVAQSQRPVCDECSGDLGSNPLCHDCAEKFARGCADRREERVRAEPQQPGEIADLHCVECGEKVEFGHQVVCVGCVPDWLEPGETVAEAVGDIRVALGSATGNHKVTLTAARVQRWRDMLSRASVRPAEVDVVLSRNYTDDPIVQHAAPKHDTAWPRDDSGREIYPDGRRVRVPVHGAQAKQEGKCLCGCGSANPVICGECHGAAVEAGEDACRAHQETKSKYQAVLEDRDRIRRERNMAESRADATAARHIETQREVERLKAQLAEQEKRVGELEQCLRRCVDALDQLMGDSDLDHDDSPAFWAVQHASRLFAGDACPKPQPESTEQDKARRAELLREGRDLSDKLPDARPSGAAMRKRVGASEPLSGSEELPGCPDCGRKYNVFPSEGHDLFCGCLGHKTPDQWLRHVAERTACRCGESPIWSTNGKQLACPIPECSMGTGVLRKFYTPREWIDRNEVKDEGPEEMRERVRPTAGPTEQGDLQDLPGQDHEEAGAVGEAGNDGP